MDQAALGQPNETKPYPFVSLPLSRARFETLATGRALEKSDGLTYQQGFETVRYERTLFAMPSDKPEMTGPLCLV